MDDKRLYLSCIKIRGVPILPPLINPERKKELLEYKEKAVLLEQSLQKRRSFCLPDLKHENNIDSNTSGSVQSVFPENYFKEVDMKYVPYAPPNLERLISDISNFDSSKDVGCNSSYINEHIPKPDDNTQKPEICTDKESQYSSDHQCEDSSKPRLIRSNSYTLDNPSSILLDHLKRHTPSLCEQSVSSGNNSENFKSLEWKAVRNKEISSGTEHLIDLLALDETKTEKNYKTDDINAHKKPSLEVITTDITIQQINFTTSDVIQEDVTQSPCEQIESKSLGNEDDSTDPEIELNLILQQIPQNYANKIKELIRVQQNEHLKRKQNYETLKAEMLQSGDFKDNSLVGDPTPRRIFVTSTSNPQSNTVMSGAINNQINRSGSVASHYNSTIEKSSTSSLNKSQTLPFEISESSCESLDNFSLRTFRILDFEDKIGEDYFKNSNEKSTCLLNEVILRREDITDNDELNDFKQRELQILREEKAASIIGAYAKGYLVRRLMNTAKVRRIIQTIQDALVCALELQKSEIIEEADVELHRRLIKLVSTACNEFHDIFFALTIPEQMDIIAIDRQKGKKTLAVRTTHSSVELSQVEKISSNNIRYSLSETKI